MPCPKEILDEINILARYNLATTQEGIKVHKDADPGVIAAVQRLHRKGLVSQSDGGYLTSLGLDAAEHVQAALRLLTPPG
jgi:uncharacterized protein (TIGR02647 family)